VKLLILDGDGFPIQTSGVTNYPGLYFVGMPWMPTERPGFLLGVGERQRSPLSSRKRGHTPPKKINPWQIVFAGEMAKLGLFIP